MEDRVGAGRDDALDQRRVSEIARYDRHAWIGDGCADDVDEHELAYVARFAPRVGERAVREERAGKTAAEEAGATGDDDAHETSREVGVS